VRKVLYHIVCGAWPAAHAEAFAEMAKQVGWDVCVVATPMATRFADLGRLAELTGRPVRHDFKNPREEDLFPPPSAIAVAPATFNTINKLAAGISDTLALGLLCEHLVSSVPIVMAPKVGASLTAHPQYRRSIAELRSCGVQVLDPQTYSSASLPGSAQLWERVLEALRTVARHV
jgi:phosphopantothenoylcysteine synthetase/decarboxylase